LLLVHTAIKHRLQYTAPLSLARSVIKDLDMDLKLMDLNLSVAGLDTSLVYVELNGCNISELTSG